MSCPDKIYDWIIDAAKELSELTKDQEECWETGIMIGTDPDHEERCWWCQRYHRIQKLVDKVSDLW